MSTKSGYMRMSVTFEMNGESYEAELAGPDIKLWRGYGLPSYEGPISGLEEEVLNELFRIGAIKKT